MHLNCILQDLFRDTPLDHILCDQIRQKCQICQMSYLAHIFGQANSFFYRTIPSCLKAKKCVEFNYKSSKFHNLPKQQLPSNICPTYAKNWVKRDLATRFGAIFGDFWAQEPRWHSEISNYQPFLTLWNHFENWTSIAPTFLQHLQLRHIQPQIEHPFLKYTYNDKQ